MIYLEDYFNIWYIMWYLDFIRKKYKDIFSWFSLKLLFLNLFIYLTDISIIELWMFLQIFKYIWKYKSLKSCSRNIFFINEYCVEKFSQQYEKKYINVLINI